MPTAASLGSGERAPPDNSQLAPFRPSHWEQRGCPSSVAASAPAMLAAEESLLACTHACVNT